MPSKENELFNKHHQHPDSHPTCDEICFSSWSPLMTSMPAMSPPLKLVEATTTGDNGRFLFTSSSTPHRDRTTADGGLGDFFSPPPPSPLNPSPTSIAVDSDDYTTPAATNRQQAHYKQQWCSEPVNSRGGGGGHLSTLSSTTCSAPGSGPLSPFPTPSESSADQPLSDLFRLLEPDMLQSWLARLGGCESPTSTRSLVYYPTTTLSSSDTTTPRDSLGALASALSACLGGHSPSALISREEDELVPGLSQSDSPVTALASSPGVETVTATMSELEGIVIPQSSMSEPVTSPQHEWGGPCPSSPPSVKYEQEREREVSSTVMIEENSGTTKCLFNTDGMLQLEHFKVLLCRNESLLHDRKTCPFYHSLRDQRRMPVHYKAEQCPDHFDSDSELAPLCCSRRSRCDKCHNRHELLYHPEIYKQRFCSSYNQLESQFFMLRFKTLWCPYGIQHDWHGCLYAHTYQDCRRSPLIGYGSEPCPYWQKDLHSADYNRRCPYGPRCPYSHGSKEQLYHPSYYKTMPCSDHKIKGHCPRMQLCAFYHDLSERRRNAVNLKLSKSTDQHCIINPNDQVPEDGPISTALAGTDYSNPISSKYLSFLQPSFMKPPLFNLDDFEAFGHSSRPSTDRLSHHYTDTSMSLRSRVSVGIARSCNKALFEPQLQPHQRSQNVSAPLIIGDDSSFQQQPPPRQHCPSAACHGPPGLHGGSIRRTDRSQEQNHYHPGQPNHQQHRHRHYHQYPFGSEGGQAKKGFQ